MEHAEIGEVVGNSDAGVVDEDVKIGGLADCLLNLRSIGDVQRHLRHAWVAVSKCAPSAGKNSFRSPREGFFNKSLTDAAVGSGD